MKILIQSTNGGAHQFINLGLKRAFDALGHQAILWTNTNISDFDIFDKVEPDIFLGQTYNLNEAQIKCIKSRPMLRVALRASDRSNFSIEVGKKYPVLTASDREIQLVDKLRDLTGGPIFLHNHYLQESLEKTHEDWIQDGYKVVSLLNAADIFQFYGGTYKEEYKSDICFVGGRWGYKSQTLDPYIVRLCQSKYNYNIKIFGNSSWGIPQYCGYAPDNQVNNILSSATICPNISEPHSQEFGYDIIERPFKLLSNKCFCISDYVSDLVKIIPNGIIYAKTPSEFKEFIDYYLSNPEERNNFIQNGFNEVIQKHTYLNRVQTILNELKLNTTIKIEDIIKDFS